MKSHINNRIKEHKARKKKDKLRMWGGPEADYFKTKKGRNFRIFVKNSSLFFQAV